MKFSIAAILLAAASFASAEEFRVVVGRAENGTAALKFSPEQVKAKVGDRIHFEFYPKNHTVTQSSFAEPCTRQRNTATNELGVDSGFMVVPPGAEEVPVWTVEVKQDTSPIWMFCNQDKHCNSGMVFAINAPEEGERTFNTFKEKAKAATHPNPADRVTADFTPPGAPGSAPPVGTDAPPAASDSAAPTGSISGSASASSSVGALDSASLVSAQASSTVAATADQAMIAPLTSTTSSAALSAAQIPGAGIALTLAGLFAGMLL
jgi:plastocyanin